MSHRKSDIPQSPAADSAGRDLPRPAQTKVSEEERRAAWAAFHKKLAAYRASPDYKPIGPGEAVARVRALRDEWD